MSKKRIICTVTNDLNYDQRMIRICTSLTNAGYDVTLIGFKRKNSLPIIERPFHQIRIPIIVEKGKLLYVDYWLKLFFLLLFKRVDVLCAIDLDTILPVYFASVLRRKKRVYDAHELFTELQEVVTRPSVYKMWRWIEQFTVPRFQVGYTVGQYIADVFHERYGVHYGLVRNMTVLQPLTITEKKGKYILYQGAVNVGRCFEMLIPAMHHVDAQLIICGEGNFYAEAKAIAESEGLLHKVIFKGYVPPEQLKQYTLNAYIGITLFEAIGYSNKMSLANRFFDYMHSGVPQLCVQYPEYEKINSQFPLAHLIKEPTAEQIADGLNYLLNNEQYYLQLQQGCLKAREQFSWQAEEKTLIKTYAQLF